MSLRVGHRVESAVAAAVDCAGALGLVVGEPKVLHDGANVVLHLAPAPVVARVATVTAMLRPDVLGHLTREVRLAEQLTARQAPVVPTSDVLPAGPHTSGGRVLSFWQWQDLRPVSPTPREAGRVLGALHEVLADVPAPDGELLDTPLADLATFLARGRALGADPRLLDQVGDLVERLRPRLAGDERALHGDAHPGNLLATARGWRWSDLEDTSPGPLAWDLACLRATGRLDGRAAVDACPHPLSDAELAPFLLLRRLHVAAWAVAIASGRPGHLPAAVHRLRTAVDLVRAGLRQPGRGSW